MKRRQTQRVHRDVTGDELERIRISRYIFKSAVILMEREKCAATKGPE